MSAHHTYLDRMRGNVALALAEGATLAEVEAHVLAVTRGRTRPSIEDHLDGQDVAEHADTLNQFRATQPGEVPTDE